MGASKRNLLLTWLQESTQLVLYYTFRLVSLSDTITRSTTPLRAARPVVGLQACLKRHPTTLHSIPTSSSTTSRSWLSCTRTSSRGQHGCLSRPPLSLVRSLSPFPYNPLTPISELDGLKTQRKFNNGSRNHTENVGFKAQKATNWLLELMRAERRAPGTTRLRGERWSEQPVVQREGVRADDTILGCCMHFQDEAPVTLWSDDRNLCLTAESNGIPTVGGPKVGLADLKKAVAGAAAVAAGAAAMSMEVDGVVVSPGALSSLTRDRSPTMTTMTRP